MPNKRLTPEQQKQLELARREEAAEQERAASIAQQSITNWLMTLLKPVVTWAVGKVMNWLTNFFTKSG